MSRVVQYLLDEINMSSKLSNNNIEENVSIKDWQAGCPNRLKGLTGNPFWDTSQFPWVKLLEDSFEDIKSEFLALKGQNKKKSENSDESELKKVAKFQPYRSPISTSSSSDTKTSETIESNPKDKKNIPEIDNFGEFATDSGHWNVCYLYLHGLDFEENISNCPITCSILSSIPNHYHHSFFSALSPKSHIRSHFGPTNKKLRCHLPITVPLSSNGDINEDNISAWLRVGEKTKYLQEGKCIVFDDSFEHEAGNDSLVDPRVVLVVDVWHPDLSTEEVRFLEFINKAQIKTAKRLANERMQNRNKGEKKLDIEGEDFLSVILRARNESEGVVPDSQIWKYDVRDD
jgi:aspartate beta-hydroxylase